MSNDNCELCGGSGEIEAEYQDGRYGVAPCPFCVGAELCEKIAELEKQMAREIKEVTIAELDKAEKMKPVFEAAMSAFEPIEGLSNCMRYDKLVKLKEACERARVDRP